MRDRYCLNFSVPSIADKHMAYPKASPISLTGEQQSILEQIVRRTSSEQRLVERAKIILLAAAGINNTQIGEQLKLTRACVRKWRSRWENASSSLQSASAEDMRDFEDKQLITAVLSDLKRSGAPFTFSTEQVVQIVAMACEEPSQSGRPVSHWTSKDLAEEAVNRGIVDRISPRSVGRFLKRGYPTTSPSSLLAQCSSGRPS